MPHQCTNCDRTFADGSKQMLGGCPDCGGNKFQFLPASAAKRESTAAPQSEPVGEPTPADRTDPTVTKPTKTATLSADADIIEAPAEPVDSPDGVEDSAQASARRSIVTEDELPPVEASVDATAPPAEEPTDRPDLATLRKELNEQFESIKILRPGEYELNLMELYDRQEHIIALEEDGRYVINVPDTWSDDA